MSPSKTHPDPELLSRLIHDARTSPSHRKESVHAFAKGAGISHTVIARIEKGIVKKPSRDNLARIAHHAYRHPAPLAYAAGYLTADEFRRQMKPDFAEGGPLSGDHGLELSPEEINRRLRSPKISGEELDQLAEQVFRIDLDQPGLGEYQAAVEELVGGSGEEAAEFRELVAAWRSIDRHEKQRLLTVAKALGTIADLNNEVSREKTRLEAELAGRADT
jgi:transcriptional regulator with XRE-family HTH domain